jgi:tetratricopeptide (TPR) repeat protein
MQNHQVFISYSVHDRPAAEAACASLERSGLRCWMAPRDVTPGAIYTEELVDAITGARVVVLLLSPNANASPTVLREVERAVSHDVPVLPVRLEQITPSRAMELLISAAQWLDAFPPPLDRHLNQLAQSVAEVLGTARSPRFRTSAPLRPDHSSEQGYRMASSRLPPPSPCFAGRVDELAELRRDLAASGRVVLTGLTGIGKTQLAIEYVHRHASDYGVVVWVRAGTEESLVSDLDAAAKLLRLPEARSADQLLATAAVRGWFEAESDWLLVIDNADDLSVARGMLPSTSRGHVIVTTRASGVGGLGHRLVVNRLGVAESAELLLRRASLVDDEAAIGEDVAEWDDAVSIAHTLDGLPLALDQAAAFIEEAHISPAEYLELFAAEGAELLAQTADAHSESVSTTLGLAFGRIERESPAAAELIQVCAMLAPDAIPEELFAEGAEAFGGRLGDAAGQRLGLKRITGAACRYSLVDRDARSRSLRLHRLVQAVLLARMDRRERAALTARVVRAAAMVFPIPVYEAWPLCERLITHVLTLLGHVEEQAVDLPEAARLFSRAGAYLRQRARYPESERLQTRALAIAEALLGDDEPQKAWTLHNLGVLYQDARRFDEAEPLVRRALDLAERSLNDRVELSYFLSSLARLCRDTERYAEAESLARRSLFIVEHAPRADSSEIAWSLQALADVLSKQQRHTEALPLLQRALDLRVGAFGDDPYVAVTLNNIADVHVQLGNHDDAETFLLRAAEMTEKILGTEHPQNARILETYAELMRQTGREDQAQDMLARADSIRRRVPAKRPFTAHALERA